MRFFPLLLLAAALHAQTPAPTSSPDNAGRQALTNQLDAFAAQETAARREAIAQIHTKQQAIARQRAVRARMIALLGGPWPEHSPLNPRITGASDHEGIHIERILFDSQANFPVTALLYLPTTTPGAPGPDSRTRAGDKLPAILMAPGHSPAGKAGDAAFALAFAHRGFAVLSYDPIGQGERLQYPDPANPGHTLLKGPTGEHGEAGLQPTLIGDALARYFLIDAIRATDYLLTRPEIDAHRIGAFGCSGGGLMTALTAALDTRIAVAGIACFTTSFDTLLPSIGPQDSEQSTPDFISDQPAPSDFAHNPGAPGPDSRTRVSTAPQDPRIPLDFPDWSELFAPKPYAIIATTEDMFPFAGAQSTEKESRAFYTLFNAQDDLAFITGPGHHGNLRPILPQILDFFTTHLRPSITVNSTEPRESAANRGGSGETPASPASTLQRPAGPPPPVLLAADTQVTPTGQVSTSYPNTETIFTLNLKRAQEKLPGTRVPLSISELKKQIYEVTHAQTGALGFSKALYSKRTVMESTEALATSDGSSAITIKFEDGHTLPARLYSSDGPGKHPIVLYLCDDLSAVKEDSKDQLAVDELVKNGSTVVVFTPRPSPPGIEETKSPVLGTFYLSELRAELTGKTLLGLRVDDVVNVLRYYIETNRGIDPNNITAEASGHMALVLLHAAILDPRLKHITLHALPPTYNEYLHQPIPRDAPQDILPGVLLHYDTPDLIRVLGSRVTIMQ